MNLDLKKTTFIIFCIGLLLGCASKSSTSNATTKTWTQVTTADDSKPIARHEAAFVNVGKKMFLLGGRGIKAVSVFDTETNKWSKGAKSPIELHHFQPVVYQTKVYIIGALTGPYPAEKPVPNIYIYDTQTDVWSVGEAIPVERLRGSTANAIQGSTIYISCGITNGHIDGHQKKVDCYDIKTNKWQVLPDAPRARDHFQAAIANGKIYLVGGRLSKAPNNTFTETIAEVDVYDCNKKQWQTLKDPVPHQRAGSMTTFFHNEILLIGGESIYQNQAHNEVDALNVATHQWRSLPGLVTGRHGSGIVVFENALYIASGCGNRGGSPELLTMENY